MSLFMHMERLVGTIPTGQEVKDCTIRSYRRVRKTEQLIEREELSFITKGPDILTANVFIVR